MANSKQAEKRIRVSEKKRLYNRAIRTRIRHVVKEFKSYVASPDFKPEEGRKRLAEIYSHLDRGWSKGVYRRNTVSRYKSRLAGLMKTAKVS